MNFTGQNQDIIGGQFDFMFRQYSPTQGRWFSPDPLGIGAANPAEPQSWNRYAYVGGNPLIWIDPLGLRCITIDDGNGNQIVADDGNAPPCGNVTPATGVFDVNINDSFPSSGGGGGSYTYGVSVLRDERQDPNAWKQVIAKLGLRSHNQSYTQCLGQNSGAYSIAGVFNIQNGAGEFLLGNDVNEIAFGDTSKGAAGIFLEHGGASSFETGVGAAGTFGRRTATIFDLNLSGATGPAPAILGKTGAEEVAGFLSGLAEVKLAVDVGLSAAEALGCAIPR